MLFVDDIVLIDELRMEVIVSWSVGETLESQGFKLSRSEYEYMKC